MSDKLLNIWWALPVMSAVLLVLAFHPFNLWPLAFIALVPLYYFAARSRLSLKKIFMGGFTTGGIFALSLSYFTVIQFRWIPQAHLFADIVHFGFIPIGLLGGLLCGGSCALIYRLLRTDSLLFNILTGAAAYTLAEILLYAICGGYYFAMLGYAASPLPFFLAFAPVGGAFFVSFLVALINSALAEGLAAERGENRSYAAAIGILVATVLAVYALSGWYLSRPTEQLGPFSIATIQTSSRDTVGFGSQKDGVFTFPALEQRLRAAGSSAPDLLIYPFSPVEGAMYSGAAPSFNKNILAAKRDAFIAWTKPLLPASTTLMAWTTLYENTKFYNVFEFLQNGALVSEYRKRDIFPFIDYTPQWAQRLGFYTTQIDMTAGDGAQVVVDGMPAGTMLCSEIHKQSLAQNDARSSYILISAGSEAIFVDGVASEYSLKAAQFRAAENDLPAVRANVLGPSAVIDRHGTVVSRLNRGEAGVLHGTVILQKPHLTLYNRFGNTLITLLVLGILLGAFAARLRARYNI